VSELTAIQCLRESCKALAEKSTALRQWTVRMDELDIVVELTWTDHNATILVRGPDHPKSFGRSASFTFSIQMDEATQLMSHELEIGLGRFLESVRKHDPGELALPQPGPILEPGSDEPSGEPASDEPASDEPEVPMHVVSQPAPGGEKALVKSRREDWISEAADRAHGKHQEQLNVAIFLALKCQNDPKYPHTSTLNPPPDEPQENAHRFLVEHLSTGFSLSEFASRFGMSPQDCSSGYPILLSFEALEEQGDQVISRINHTTRLRVYQMFVYSPRVYNALLRQFQHEMDAATNYMELLMKHGASS
jgi:hypothetical protein